MKLFTGIVCWGLVLFILPGRLCLADAVEVETVVVTAESVHSFDDATQRAIRNAVRQVAGLVMVTDTGVRDFVLIRDTIYSRAAGYTRSYEVLDRRRTLEDTYFVRVRAEVSTGSIAEDELAIKSLIELVGRPTFITVVDERGDSEEGARDWVRGAVNNQLEQTGFSAIHAETRDEADAREALQAIAAGDRDTAERLRLQMGAPYGILIVAFAGTEDREVHGLSANYSVVELQVTAVHRDTGEILASKDGAGRAGSTDTSGMREAAGRAVRDTFPQVVERILYHWSRDMDVGSAFTVRITGAPFETTDDLKRAIRENFDGVNSVHLSEAPPGGTAVLRVIARAQASSLASFINSWGRGRLEVGVSGPRTVTAAYTEEDPPAGEEPDSPDDPEAAEPAPTHHDYTLPAIILGAGLLLGLIAAAAILRKK